MIEDQRKGRICFTETRKGLTSSIELMNQACRWIGDNIKIVVREEGRLGFVGIFNCKEQGLIMHARINRGERSSQLW